MQTREYTINAAGKRLGIVATLAATYLQGKDMPDYAKNVVAPVKVTIVNASQLDVSVKKGTEVYQTYSGYPGGQTRETLAHLALRRGFAEPLRRTIDGMLPKNKLRSILMKNLIVTE
ncbi:MAG: hypothetical protein AUK16_02290 [Parcubacteria group bacterium CG2_30_44_11]|nr:MAG: hypothetical protein AUK16_02290 [Parcubacteria group bacterium CG2_30_44_11]